MKESTRFVSAEIEVIHTETGELIPMKAVEQIQDKYYSISKLTSRINAMNLLDKLSEICKSSKDIELINKILELHNSSNIIIIHNISEKAKDLDITRSKLNELLKRSVDKGFMRKLDTGVYFINPFIFVGRKVKSNELRELAQKEWKELIDIKYMRRDNPHI